MSPLVWGWGLSCENSKQQPAVLSLSHLWNNEIFYKELGTRLTFKLLDSLNKPTQQGGDGIELVSTSLLLMLSLEDCLDHGGIGRVVSCHVTWCDFKLQASMPKHVTSSSLRSQCQSANTVTVVPAATNGLSHLHARNTIREPTSQPYYHRIMEVTPGILTEFLSHQRI